MTNQPKLEHPAPKDAKSALETWRILLLDDNAQNIEQLTKACIKDGYVVVATSTIKAAWVFLNGKDHVDVIVCAAHLEEESMFQFLKDVRSNEKHGKVAFLILSLDPSTSGARLDRSTERAGMLLGADGYVVMPVFDATELVAQIQQLLPAVPMLQQSATDQEKKDAA